MASTERGVFAILAVDHRDALHLMLDRERVERTERQEKLVVETVRRVGALKLDILKLEFQIDCKYEKDEIR